MNHSNLFSLLSLLMSQTWLSACVTETSSVIKMAWLRTDSYINFFQYALGVPTPFLAVPSSLSAVKIKSKFLVNWRSAGHFLNICLLPTVLVSCFHNTWRCLQFSKCDFSRFFVFFLRPRALFLPYSIGLINSWHVLVCMSWN